MTPSERTLALALVLGAYFSSAGKCSQHSHFPTGSITHIQAQAIHRAVQLETKTGSLFAMCTARYCACGVLPGALEHLGIPVELVRESA